MKRMIWMILFNRFRIFTKPTNIKSGIDGIAWQKGRIFTISRGANRIFVFHDQHPFSEVEGESIDIPDMRWPRDMVTTPDHRSLCVCDTESKCVWVVSMETRKFHKLPISGEPRKLSISRSNKLLLVVETMDCQSGRTSWHLNDSSRWCLDVLCNFGSPDVTPGKDRIYLPHQIQYPEHAVWLSTENIVVAHQVPEITSNHLFAVSELTKDGRVLHSTVTSSVELPIQLKMITHLAVNEDDDVFALDLSCRGIILLSRKMASARLLQTKDDQHNQVIEPHRLCYSRDARQLIVGGHSSFSVLINYWLHDIQLSTFCDVRGGWFIK